MANSGLSVDDVVQVGIDISPQAAQERNFGNLIIVGDTDIIDVSERIRSYSGTAGMAADGFDPTDPEFLAAEDFFAQVPEPVEVFVGRWASTPTHGLLRGAPLTSAEEALNLFTAINAGGVNIHVDGVNHAITNLDFSAQNNLNGVAAVLQTAFAGAATVVWDSNAGEFLIESATSGGLSSVGFATAPSSGQDISVLLGLTQAAGAQAVAGIAAESIETCIANLADQSTDWYGLQIAASVAPADGDYVAVGKFIESANPSRIFGVTTQEAGVLSAQSTTDLAALMSAAAYNRTFTQYSSQDAYASASLFGRALTVDYEATDSVITLDFKVEPGVVPEAVTETQKQTLASKFCNAFLKFNNNTAILQQGWMASGTFIDVIQGADWLQNAIQTAVYNLLLTLGKIPQTDAGLNRIVSVISSVLDQSVANGLVAPGIWTGPDVGSIVNGQTLTKGYYIFAPLMATQSQADRAARKTPPIQVAIKLAGAFHSANIMVNVNQ